MAQQLDAQLTSLHSTIEELLEVSHSPGLSLGILHNGSIVHTAHFGRRDAFNPTPPDDDTLYHIASLTKLMAAGVVSQLVYNGTLSWDKPIREYLPTFAERQDDIGQKATLRDLLSNRTGIAVAHGYWGQQAGEFLIPKSEIVRMSCSLDAVKPFRKSFIYSHWNYGLITEVVEKMTGKPFSECMETMIFKPLNMHRSTMNVPTVENVSGVHAIRNDGTACKIPYARWSDETGFGAGAGGRSSIKDLLLMYQSVLSAYNHQIKTEVDSTSGSPFRYLRTIFSPHVTVSNDIPLDQLAYCLGAYRIQLPCNLSIASMNNFLLRKNERSLTGSSLAGLEVFHHTATFPGSMASMFLIPSTESAVVALTNALPLLDPTDLVAQLVFSVLIGKQQLPLNSIKLAKSIQGRFIAGYEMLAAHLESQKTDTPPRFPLLSYEGDYYNKAGNFFYRVTVHNNSLHVSVQALPVTTYDLQHLDGDTFYWPPNREDEICNRGMWLVMSPEWHKWAFGSSVEGAGYIDHFTWHHDPSTSPEVFSKRRVVTSGARL